MRFPVNANVRKCARATSVQTLLALLILAGGPAHAEAQTAPAPDAGVDAGTETESEPGPDAGTEPEAEPEPTPEPEPAPQPEPVIAPVVTREIDTTTGIGGQIMDSATQLPLADAPVIVQRADGPPETTLSDADGRFHLYVRPGRYTVRSYYDLYHGARIVVRVAQGRITPLRLMLDPIDEESDVAVDAVEVTYRADMSGEGAGQAIQQAAAVAQDINTSEGMSRSGASNASDGARQVAGVLIENDQPIIRGLQGQYVQVLLNGTPVPSTDPEIPGVDLDLFPTSIIENLAVLKTFLPEMTASWAGGVVDIRTIRYPNEFLLELGVSVGGNTQTTFRPVLDYDGGRLDWTGFDRSRELPSTVPNQIVAYGRGDPFTLEEANAIGRTLDNTWQYERSTAIPNISVGGSVGNSHSLGEGRRFGYLLTAGYGIDTSRETGINRYRPTFAADGSLVEYNRLETELGQRSVDLNVLGTTSVDLTADSSISLLALFNRSTEDNVEFQQGTLADLDSGSIATRWQLQYLARTLFFTQLRGDHRNLGDTELRLRWTAFGGLGRRDEPDRRSMLYGYEQRRWIPRAGSGDRFYSDLEQRDFGLDTSLQVPLWSTSAGEAQVTLGGTFRYSDRTLLNRRFRMQQLGNQQGDDPIYAAPPEELFSAEGIGTLTRFQEFTEVDDSYASAQSLYAGFLSLDTPIVRRLTLNAGARFEVFDQFVESSSPVEVVENPARTDRTDWNVLPAAALKYSLADDMNLRLSYGMTMVRAQVRQLAPFQYYDFQRDRNIEGDPELDSTGVHNVDARWEWFFSDTERVTVSAFYKQLDGYIYAQIEDPNTYSTVYRNAGRGYVAGGEVEGAVSFERIHRRLRHLSLLANATVLHSELNLIQTLGSAIPEQIPVPGQAPFVFNLSLRFDEPVSGFSAAIVYNVVGPRVTDVGVRSDANNIYPNIRRMPFHQLDFVASWQANDHLKLKLKFKNILFQSQDWHQGNFLESRVSPGASFSIGLDYQY
jgi:outer membrane receptor for ferrienterochelin and colicin